MKKLSDLDEKELQQICWEAVQGCDGFRDALARVVGETGVEMSAKTAWRHSVIHTMPQPIKESGMSLRALADVWLRLSDEAKALLEGQKLSVSELRLIPKAPRPELYIADTLYRRIVKHVAQMYGDDDIAVITETERAYREVEATRRKGK